MATRKEIDEYYIQLYGKKFPSATLSRWVKQGRISVEMGAHNSYNYSLEDFIREISTEDYKKHVGASREKPGNYIGKIKGSLLIKSIVPKEEYKSKYKGTLMYCDCLACGNTDVQVRFTYLSDNGNYNQLTCGCGRKVRAFLASSRPNITEEFLNKYTHNFEKFLMVHKMLTHITDNYYGTKCDIEEYETAVDKIFNDKQFNAVYNFWQKQESRTPAFYDWAKPSLDHIIPLSKGGTSKIDNLQVLTVFENLSKRDLTQEEWNEFKKITNTNSDLFIENIMKER